MALISVKKLTFTYNGVPVLKDVTLNIMPGKVVALLGPNGSGKTTLLRCIYGVLKPKVRCVYLDGKDLCSLTPQELAKRIGGLPQDHQPIFPYRSVDIVTMGRAPYLSLFSAPTIRDYEEASNLLSELGIGHLALRPYTTLSGGERQLVLIARVLMQRPKALLFDEPISHLDIKNKVKILALIRELARSKDVAILMTVHEPNYAIMFSDKIMLLNEGRVVYDGPPDGLTEEMLERVYDIPLRALRGEDCLVFLPDDKRLKIHQ